ncbi:MAG: hypothetical protein WCL06_10265 [Bacteroidota bacterium]
MGKISQKGHYQNMAAIYGMYGLVKAKGAAWTPVDTSLTDANILLKWEEMRDSFKIYIKEKIGWGTKVNFRELGMETVNPLMTRVKNEVMASTANANFKADVVSKVKKIQGVRATPKMKMEADTPDVPTDDSVDQISAAQTGIDDKLGNVGELIALLGAEPLYTTQINELKVVNLGTWLDDLNDNNQAVTLQHGVMSTKRLERNKSFYDEVSGGCVLASKLRNAFKSQYGGNSPQYHEVTKFKFVTPKL